MTGSTTQTAKDWITLYRLLEQSQQAMQGLLACFETPGMALAASAATWRQTGAVPAAKIALFERWQHGDEAEADTTIAATLAWLAEAPDRHLLTPGDPAYPRLLSEIADPPPLLFVRGDPALLSLPQIAIVGSRHPSRSGEDLAREFARELAGRGLTITSGMALGIDAAAHGGALAGGGATIAVLGTGPDRLYPRTNLALAGEVLASGGLIISEYLPGTPPLAPNFPRRNRIISGLSMGVLVVEAALRSGSLITARLAGEQGREVWAMPGSVHNPQAKGCHVLIRDGAKLVEEAAHVLEDIGPLLGLLQEDIRQPRKTTPAAPAEGPQASVLEALGWECRSLDWLVDATSLPAGELSALLMQLELDGQIAAVPGGYERLSG
jgi:DNA processing protein